MKNIKRNRWMVAASAVLLLFLAGCKKDDSPNIFNMFDDVTLTLHTTHPFSMGEYKLVNDGDSVYIDYTITSGSKDMYAVALLKVGSAVPTKYLITDPAKRRSYSDIIRLKANENVGKTTYRIWGLDKDGVYLGDGKKQMTIEVAPNFIYLANRNIYYPDSVGKTQNNYLSLTTGATFNYATGQANSANIDLGIYRKALASPAIGFSTHLYALTANPLPYTIDNISTWTKRATLFSAPIANQASTFNTTLTTGTKIQTEAKKRTINLTSITANIIAGNLIYFLTPEGKYGALLVNAITTNYDGAPFVNVSIKLEK